MDGSINKSILVNLQKNDSVIKEHLTNNNLVLQNYIIMKETKHGRFLALPDKLEVKLAENLHYRHFDHKPAETILGTVSNFLYTPSLKQIVEKTCAECGQCLLEEIVTVGRGLGDTMIYDNLKPGDMLAVD